MTGMGLPVSYRIVPVLFLSALIFIPAVSAQQPGAAQTDMPVLEGESAPLETEMLIDSPLPEQQIAPSPRAGETAFSMQDGSGGSSLLGNLIRIVFVLALLAAAAYGVVYFIKQSKKNPLNENPHLKVLASVPINARTQAAVVAVGEKAYLVGAGDAGVSLIAEVTSKETIDALLLDYARSGAAVRAGSLSFKSLLRLFGMRMNDNANGGGHDLHTQRERMKRL
jgi:flagellar protein FliO/FliZ